MPKDGLAPSLISCETISSSLPDFSILRENMEQISDLLLAYRTTSSEASPEVAVPFSIPPEELPQILFGVLQEFEKLQAEHRRYSLVVSQYEKTVTKHFNMLGVVEPPTLLGEENKLWTERSRMNPRFRDGDDAPFSDTALNRKTFVGPRDSSVWVWKHLAKLKTAISESGKDLTHFLRDPCPSDHFSSEAQAKTKDFFFGSSSTSEVLERDIWNAIKASNSLPEDAWCSDENSKVANHSISTVLNAAVASVEGWRHVAHRMMETREKPPLTFILELEKEIQSRIFLLQGEGEETNEVQRCPATNARIVGEPNVDPKENELLGEDIGLRRLCKLWKTLDLLIVEHHAKDGRMGWEKEEWSKQKKALEEERSRCRKLEREREDAIESLSIALYGCSSKQAGASDIRDTRPGISPSGSAVPASPRAGPEASTVAKEDALSSLMNCLNANPKENTKPISENNEKDLPQNDLRSLISEFQQRWKSTLTVQEKREQGLKRKLNELGSLKDVLQEHAKAMRSEMPPKWTEGEEEWKLDKKEESNGSKAMDTSPLFLPEEFEASQVKDHLTFLRRKYIGLLKQQRCNQYDHREQKAQLEKLTHQLGLVKKWQTQCSGILLRELAPLLGLEDEVGIFLWKEESAVAKKVEGANLPSSGELTKKTEKNTSPPPPMLSGSMIVSILNIFTEDLKRIRNAKLAMEGTSASSPSPLIPPTTALHETRSEQSSATGEGSKEKGWTPPAAPKDAATTALFRSETLAPQKVEGKPKAVVVGSDEEGTFRVAMQAVLQRLTDNGKRMKETLFLLGTDEAPVDDLLEEVTRMLSNEEKRTKANALAKAKADGKPPLPERINGPGKGSMNEGVEAKSGPNEKELPVWSTMMVEQRLAELLQKHTRWTTRLLETVEDHRAAQRRFSQHFASVLYYFSSLSSRSCETIPSSFSSGVGLKMGAKADALPSSFSSSETGKVEEARGGGIGAALREVAEGIVFGREPLDNLIDLDCVLLDSIEMLLPIIEEDEERRKKGDIPFPMQRKRKTGEETLEKRKEHETEQEPGTGREGKDDAVPYQREEKTSENSSLHELCDQRLIQLYQTVRETHTILFGLTRVQYLVAPQSERDPDPTRLGSNRQQQKERNEEADDSDVMKEKNPIESAQSGYVDLSLSDILRADREAFSSSAARRNHNNDILSEIIAQNLQCIQKELFFLSDAIKDVAIVLQQDIEGLRQQVMKMLADWSAVDVEGSWIGQNRAVLEALYEELSGKVFSFPNGVDREGSGEGSRTEQRTKPSSYWMARFSHQHTHARRETPSGTHGRAELRPYSPPVWEMALELLREGFAKLLVYLSKTQWCLPAASSSCTTPPPPSSSRGGGGKIEGSRPPAMDHPTMEEGEKDDTNASVDFLLAELYDIGAMYINWIENEERAMAATPSPFHDGSRPSIPPLPGVVQQYCVRESTPSQGAPPHGRPGTTPRPSERGITGQPEGVTSSSRTRKASHFASPDALPPLFMHMQDLAQRGWCAMLQTSPHPPQPEVSHSLERNRGTRKDEGSATTPPHDVTHPIPALVITGTPRPTFASPSTTTPPTPAASGGGDLPTRWREDEGPVRMVSIGSVSVPVPATRVRKATFPTLENEPLHNHPGKEKHPTAGSSSSAPLSTTVVTGESVSFPPVLYVDPETEWWWKQINNSAVFPTPPLKWMGGATAENATAASSSAERVPLHSDSHRTTTNDQQEKQTRGGPSTKEHGRLPSPPVVGSSPSNSEEPSLPSSLKRSTTTGTAVPSPSSSRETMLQEVLSYLRNTLDPSSWSYIEKAREASVAAQKHVPHRLPARAPIPSSSLASPPLSSTNGKESNAIPRPAGVASRVGPVGGKTALEKKKQKEEEEAEERRRREKERKERVLASSMQKSAQDALSSGKKHVFDEPRARPEREVVSSQYPNGKDLKAFQHTKEEEEEEDHNDRYQHTRAATAGTRMNPILHKKQKDRSQHEEEKEVLRKRRLRRELGLSLLSEKERRILLGLLEGEEADTEEGFPSAWPSSSGSLLSTKDATRESYPPASRRPFSSSSSLPAAVSTTGGAYVPTHRTEGVPSCLPPSRHRERSSTSATRIRRRNENAWEEQDDEEERVRGGKERRRPAEDPDVSSAAVDPVLFGTRSARLRTAWSRKSAAPSQRQRSTSSAVSPPRGTTTKTHPMPSRTTSFKEAASSSSPRGTPSLRGDTAQEVEDSIRRSSRSVGRLHHSGRRHAEREEETPVSKREKGRGMDSSSRRPTKSSSSMAWEEPQRPTTTKVSLSRDAGYASSWDRREKGKNRDWEEEDEDEEEEVYGHALPSSPYRYDPGEPRGRGAPARAVPQEKTRVQTRDRMLPRGAAKRPLRAPSTSTPQEEDSFSDTASFTSSMESYSSTVSSITPYIPKTRVRKGAPRRTAPVKGGGTRAGFPSSSRTTMTKSPSPAHASFSTSRAPLASPVFSTQSQYPASVSRCVSVDGSPPRRMRVGGTVGNFRK